MTSTSASATQLSASPAPSIQIHFRSAGTWSMARKHLIIPVMKPRAPHLERHQPQRSLERGRSAARRTAYRVAAAMKRTPQTSVGSNT